MLKTKSLMSAMLAMIFLILPGCGKASMAGHSAYIEKSRDDVAEGRELLCLADSYSEAEKTAEMYGIELVSWQDKVAVFHTDKDLDEVINQGKENGWVLLEKNRVYTVSNDVKQGDKS